jgi:hypothetical protein
MGSHTIRVVHLVDLYSGSQLATHWQTQTLRSKDDYTLGHHIEYLSRDCRRVTTSVRGAAAKPISVSFSEALMMTAEAGDAIERLSFGELRDQLHIVEAC